MYEQKARTRTLLRKHMPFLVSIRISGDDVRGSELVHQFDPHLEALLENLRSVPGVEV